MAPLELVVDNGAEVKSEALSWPEKAKALVIKTAETYMQAGDMLKGIKALRQKIAETFDPHIQRAHQAHKALVAEKAQAEAPLTEAETVLKRGLVAFDQEQERIRREEQRRLEEIARKQEEERRIAEAAALEAQALASGDAAALAEAQEIIAAPVETPVVIVQRTTPKVAGISYRENWKGECVNLLALVQHVAQHPEHLNLVQANTTAINQAARMMKGNCKIPGVKAYSEQVAAARA